MAKSTYLNIREAIDDDRNTVVAEVRSYYHVHVRAEQPLRSLGSFLSETVEHTEAWAWLKVNSQKVLNEMYGICSQASHSPRAHYYSKVLETGFAQAKIRAAGCVTPTAVRTIMATAMLSRPQWRDNENIENST